jgi:hypothetical protein
VIATERGCAATGSGKDVAQDGAHTTESLWCDVVVISLPSTATHFLAVRTHLKLHLTQDNITKLSLREYLCDKQNYHRIWGTGRRK